MYKTKNLLRVGLIQMDPVLKKRAEREDKKVNLGKALRLINQAAKESPDIVCFPEFAFTGPASTVLSIEEISETIPGPITEALGKKAREYSLYIVANLLERDEDRHFNSNVIISPKGEIIGRYRKVHLYPPEQFLTLGSRFLVCETEFGKIGMLICYDIAFPESARILALKGAKIVFCPTMGPAWLLEFFKRCAQARAIENQIYLVVVNVVGTHPGTGEKIIGKSFVAYPTGEITELGEEEQIFMVTIDFKEIENIKKRWWPLKDRHPETYAEIVKL
ncbi:MAG: carbon-nitrogen hydrolase family protein [Candidatus Aerophobetes bacterium]|nr:carbon-nitrogen hydrolase family protein [Candidatus Aerophobetes bacterium]